MPAEHVDLIFEQGATFTQNFQWVDENGTPIDLTGYSARMQVRDTVDSPAFHIELTDANGRIALGGTAGTIQLTIAATDTAALTFEDAVYDLELVNGATVTRLVYGGVQLRPEVTR